MKPHLVLIACMALCLPASAHAYIDPGSGMLMWQGLIALIGAVLVFVRSPWKAVKRLVERLRRR